MELALFVFAVLLVAIIAVAVGGYAVGFSRGESQSTELAAGSRE